MWLNILLTIIGLVVIVFIWGILHLRHSQKVALREIAAVQLPQIPALAEECIAGFAQHFGETLSLDDFDASAQVFGNRLDDSESLKKAFGKDEFYWYFVLPCGAFLGELLRRHAGGEWAESEDEQAPELQLTVGEEAVTTFPFDKIIKHATVGDPGDMYAYIISTTRLDRVIAELESQDTE